MLLKRCDWLPRLNQKCFKTGESPLGLLRTNVRRNQFEQADHTKTAYLTIEILIFDLDFIYIKREIFSHNTSAIFLDTNLASRSLFQTVGCVRVYVQAGETSDHLIRDKEKPLLNLDIILCNRST